jgi:hypothetical protein
MGLRAPPCPVRRATHKPLNLIGPHNTALSLLAPRPQPGSSWLLARVLAAAVRRASAERASAPPPHFFNYSGDLPRQ